MEMQKIAELRKKANTLPMEPGVYLMRDRRGEIIYVALRLIMVLCTSGFRYNRFEKSIIFVSE